MNENSSPLLDLRLAWRRILQDPADRAFVNHPFEFCLVQIDCEGFLNDLSKALQEKKFSPSPVYIANVPKGKGAVRPGAVLGIKDRIVYTACLGQMLPQVHRALKWNSQPIDFSYPITEHYEHDRWIVGQFKSWQQFRAASLDRLKGMSYAVLADITGYYENIDLATLRSDLATTGADPTTISLLMDCLNKWAQIGGRGIPQGLTPSDILGKLYLNSVDRALAESGYCHCRYVDDIRIFCPDYASAKKALVDLSVLLRKRGLNVQTAKSAIHRADEAKTQIEGITSVILDVRKRFLNDVQDLLGLEGYLTFSETEQLLAERDGETPVEVLRETYKAFFIDADPYKFDKTLFHFLIRRLGKSKDRFAIEHCKTLLERQPQETAYALTYFSAVGASDEVQPALAEFVVSKDAVYGYQIYQIFEWLLNAVNVPIDPLLRFARTHAASHGAQPYLLSVYRKFLAKFGSVSDLEGLEHAYSAAGSSLEQAELMCCLERMEKGRRNAFIRRAESDGEWNRRAAQWVRSR